jgi:hypothetical protein
MGLDERLAFGSQVLLTARVLEGIFAAIAIPKADEVGLMRHIHALLFYLPCTMAVRRLFAGPSTELEPVEAGATAPDCGYGATDNLQSNTARWLITRNMSYLS